MQRVVKSFGVLVMLSLGIGAGSASATPLIVFSANPAWVLVPGSNATYVLPETPDAGPTVEPTGTFYFNQPWTGTPQYFSLLDIPVNGVNGPISDIITFDSFGPGGVARVLFFSDPTFPPAGFLSNYSNTNIFFDTVGVTDPQSVCCITNSTTQLTLVMGSDRDVPFRPFGVTFDTSDGIQFQGAQDGGSPVPEPASLTLLGIGLAGIATRLRRKRQ